jgi:hypothetical protein
MLRERKQQVMSENNERKIAYVIALVCLVVGIVVYAALPSKSSEEPVRVMYESTGENVLFSHMEHTEDYGQDCFSCHHEIAYDESKGHDSCGSCHDAESTRVPALGQDGRFDHETHSQYYGLSCTDCHHMYDPDSGSQPQNCNACHMETGDDYMPSLSDSYHQQCIGCHQDFGVGPTTENCNDCHGPRKRADAFHDQCTGCHEQAGQGPLRDDCTGCHAY